MKYRPEIDGLRAIAVLAVIIYHTRFFIDGQLFLPGGYLGVDIFFVISGFLITSIIASQLQAEQGFSFANFYQRRARRLLPILFTVLICCMPFAWWLLYPGELLRFANSALASAFFVANIFWYHVLAAYSAPSGLVMPLLHTWSLGVEEQFYLIFPSILILTIRYAKKYLYSVLMLLIILSFGYSVLINQENNNFAFFMLPTRFWELMIGAVLAIYMLNKPRPKNGLLSSGFLIMGFLSIIFAFSFIPLNSYHPGQTTLAAILGTGLIIYYANPKNIVIKFLSNRFIVYIGLISYSLYIWHYPVLVFARLYFSGLSNIYLKLLCVLVTFLFSIISYHLIEKPFRNQEKISVKKLVATLLILLLIIMAFWGYVFRTDGADYRYYDLRKTYRNELDNEKLRRESWLKFFNDADDMQAERGFTNVNAKNRVLVIGDSEAKDIFNAFYLNRKLYPNTDFGYFRLQSNHYYMTRRHIKKSLARLQYLQQSNMFKIANYMIFASNTPKSNFSLMTMLLNPVSRRHITPIIFSANQVFKSGNIDLQYVTLFDAYVLRHRSTWSVAKINKLYYSNKIINNKKFNIDLAKKAKKDNILFINRHSIVCDDSEKICYGATNKGKKTYYDKSHWTLAGAEFFGKKIAKLMPFSSIYSKKQ